MCDRCAVIESRYIATATFACYCSTSNVCWKEKTKWPVWWLHKQIESCIHHILFRWSDFCSNERVKSVTFMLFYKKEKKKLKCVGFNNNKLSLFFEAKARFFLSIVRNTVHKYPFFRWSSKNVQLIVKMKHHFLGAYCFKVNTVFWDRKNKIDIFTHFSFFIVIVYCLVLGRLLQMYGVLVRFVNYVIIIDCRKGATTSLSQMDFVESVQQSRARKSTRAILSRSWRPGTSKATGKYTHTLTYSHIHISEVNLTRLIFFSMNRLSLDWEMHPFTAKHCQICTQIQTIKVWITGQYYKRWRAKVFQSLKIQICR